MKKTFLLILFLFCFMMLHQTSYGKDVIKVAIANNFSNYATQCSDPLGRHFKNSINLAIKNFLSRNQNFPYEIKLDVYDYGESDLKIIDIMNKIERSDAIAIIGFPCSDQALLAAKLAEEKRIVYISPQATSDNLWNYNNYTFKTCFKNSYQSKVLTDYIRSELSKKKLVIVGSNDCEYCSNMSRYFETDFKKRNGDIVKKYNVLKSDTSFSWISDELKGVDYDGIFLANYEFTSSMLISELAKRNISTTFFAGDAMGNVEGMLFKLVGDIPVSLYAISHWRDDATHKATADFSKQFYDTYGIRANDNSALAYDAMTYLLEGIKNSESKTREDLKSSLKRITRFHGLRNIIFDNKNNTTLTTVFVLRTNNKRFELVKRVEP